MASLKFRHYATESALMGEGTIQSALNALDVGTIVFIDDTQKQYIITEKKDNIVTYKIYYGKAAIVGVSGSGATRTLTWSDGSETTVTINDVAHATSADTAKSVAWNNVTGKPTNFVTTDDTQTITGAKTFTNNISLQGSTSADSITTEDLIVNGAARFVSGLTGDLVGNVTGYLTGDISGSSATCRGNADNATKDGSGNNIVNTYARIDKVYDDSDTYRQFLGKAGSNSDWIRTTSSGILPYTSGKASNGHSSLGTSYWYFASAYIQNIYGYLNGNISGSSTSCSGNSSTATRLTDLNSSDVASTTATWRKVWFCYNDNATGRPALSDNIAYQTSTSTLKVPNITLSGNATVDGYIKGETVKISSGCTLEYSSTDKCVKFVFA